MFSKEMQDALIADGEKLAQLTGEDHGPYFLQEGEADKSFSDWCVEAKKRNEIAMTKWTAPAKPEKRTYGYTVDNDEYRYEFKSSLGPASGEWLAEEAAEHDYSSGDGLSDEWPLVFGLYNGDELLGRYKIEMEHCPHFSAYGLEAAA